jgi:hypothetical protein
VACCLGKNEPTDAAPPLSYVAYGPQQHRHQRRERLAERPIEEAMREGKFDNLGRAGKPLELEDMPAGENTPMTWRALSILRQNDEIRAPSRQSFRAAVSLCPFGKTD